jgi:hypothetical protein
LWFERFSTRITNGVEANRDQESTIDRARPEPTTPSVLVGSARWYARSSRTSVTTHCLDRKDARS